ncbi:MAG: hypothetical protein PWQ42_936 [Sulfurospirillum sp.]|jgi:hypothetical protein|nr:hypothetical protein [Sulfurospirillum sp.]
MRVNSFLNSSLIRVDNQTATTQSSNNSLENSKELSTSQKALITKLQATDTKVRQHEAAHIAAGGNVIKSGANFTYQKGPDNKLYAVGGEVAIDTSKETTPQKTITKMQTIRAAALAPSDPSPTDYKVAATATLLEMKARLELSQALKEESLKSPVTRYNTNEEIETNFDLYT